MTIRTYVLLIGTMALTGLVCSCAAAEKPVSARYDSVSQTPSEKKAIASVTFYRGDETPEQEYKELGKITGWGCRERRGNSAFGAEEEAMQNMRTSAHRMSADAVIGVSCTSKEQGLGSQGCYEEVHCGGTAVAFEASEDQPGMTPAQSDESNSDWIESPVRFIMTKDERESYKKLETDAERSTAIREFWARRDTTPDTPENEYREEFYKRVEYAEETFGTWAGDRGEVLLVVGHPANRHQQHTEVWFYYFRPEALGLQKEPGTEGEVRWHVRFVRKHGFYEMQVPYRKSPTLLDIIRDLEPAAAAAVSLANKEN